MAEADDGTSAAWRLRARVADAAERGAEDIDMVPCPFFCLLGAVVEASTPAQQSSNNNSRRSRLPAPRSPVPLAGLHPVATAISRSRMRERLCRHLLVPETTTRPLRYATLRAYLL